MTFKNKTIKPWSGRDYSKSITHFIVHTMVLVIIFLATVCMNGGGIHALSGYLSQRPTQLQFIYSLISILFLVMMLYLYLYFEYRDFLKEGKNVLLVFLVIELSLVVNFLIGKYLNVYSRPLCACALLILLLVNRRVATMINVIFCLLLFIMDVFAGTGLSGNHVVYASMLIGITTGIFAVYLVDKVTSRVKVFFMGIVIAIPITIGVICFEIYNLQNVLYYVGFGITSGMSSIILMMATLPFFEQAFNVVTDYRLSEITDHKSKLIKELHDRAEGTFNHSLTISTLAESCAFAIGENALLARAAAYYHDIGKLKQPMYFTENQSGVNPHNELSPELSTDIIRAHARDGYELIRKYRLPQILADIAIEHHGTLPIKYFYAKALKYTDGELDINDFSYPGPRPQSKISAIIMICDACEAASRSIPDRNPAKVEQVVRNIIEERMTLGQLDECELTMRDIDIIRGSITQSLAGVYHDRIAYPKINIIRNRNLSEQNQSEGK